jgi:hypothetical protein
MEKVLEFIFENTVFILLILGTILFSFTIYLLLNIKSSKMKWDSPIEKLNPEEQKTYKLEQDPSMLKSISKEEPKFQTEEKPVDVIIKNGEIDIMYSSTAPDTKDSNIPLERFEEMDESEPNIVETPVETILPSSKKPAEEKIPDAKPPVIDTKKPLGKFHVLYRLQDDRWIIKRENSDKIVRVLESQREAIGYATIKALTADTVVVVHNKDGKIRSQNTKNTED